MEQRTSTSSAAVRDLQRALTAVRKGASGALDMLVASAKTVVSETAEPQEQGPYMLRRITLPERWTGYLIIGEAGNLTASERTECDALRTSVEKHGWSFAYRNAVTKSEIPTVPEGISDEMPCRISTLRRDEHPLLPPGKPATFDDYLAGLRDSMDRAADGGPSTNVHDAAEELLHAFGR